MESSAPSFYLGLPNLGNTCYIASSLQCFLNLPKIHYFFNSSPYKKTLKTENSSNSLVLLNDLFDEITSNKEFHKEVFKAFIDSFKEFCDGSQQDAQEFLKLLLERIHNLTNKGNPKLPNKFLKYQSNKDDNIQKKEWWTFFRERDQSIITDLFCGQMASSITCEACKAHNKTFEDFWDISLSFRDTSLRFDKFTRKDGYFINQMIENFFVNEVIEKRKCDKCNSENKAIKCLEISRFPQILILHIKRFYYKEDRKEKLNYFVKFPMKNLFFKKNKTSFNKVGSNTSYNLRGIIHHLGDLANGHYYAECKDPLSEEWGLFNDNDVEYIEKTEDECGKKGSDSAYILFYEKNK